MTPVATHGRLLPLPLIAIIAAGLAAIAVSLRALVLQPVGPLWFVLTASTLVSGWSTLRLRDAPVSFSISDTFTMAAALLFGPAAGAMTVLLDALVMSLRVQRTSRVGVGRRILFNATGPALA